MSRSLLYLIWIPVLWWGCMASEEPLTIASTETEYIPIDSTLQEDSAAAAFIEPYRTDLEAEMNEVVAQTDRQMMKGKPESLLGNLVSGLLLKKTEAYWGNQVDVSVINYGGLRIPGLPQGDITRGKLFELMPFDNLMVVLIMDSAGLHTLADFMAKQGGWPQTGMRFTIQDVEGDPYAGGISVNGEPLEGDREYAIAISDYLADGGDKMYFLANYQRIDLGVLVRDAIIEYFEDVQASGDTVTARLDGRVTIPEY